MPSLGRVRGRSHVAFQPIPNLSPFPTLSLTGYGSLGQTGTTTNTPALAMEGDGSSLTPPWSSLYQVGDPGDALDTDMLGDMSQTSQGSGNVRITCERHTTPSGRPFRSSHFGTRTTFSQTYGVFEARLRYDKGQGVWAAFWMLQENLLTTPPEIDIFEAYPAPPGPGGGSGYNVLIQTLHYSGGAHYHVIDMGLDMTLAMHTHRLVWTPGLLEFYVDDSLTSTINADVPSVPMYPIVKYGIGATGYRADQSAQTPDLTYMDVDYLRVWPS